MASGQWLVVRSGSAEVEPASVDTQVIPQFRSGYLNWWCGPRPETSLGTVGGWSWVDEGFTGYVRWGAVGGGVQGFEDGEVVGVGFGWLVAAGLAWW